MRTIFENAAYLEQWLIILNAELELLLNFQGKCYSFRTGVVRSEFQNVKTVTVFKVRFIPIPLIDV